MPRDSRNVARDRRLMNRATGDRRKFTHPFFIPASHYFPVFPQHSVIDRMTTTSHL
ncbi:hypothetical protein BVI1335_1650053 [Burkholderia vietnamiensis]|nr:hypothetical protein BVI1335_1650053 [Burkholderia vietnamiensis]